MKGKIHFVGLDVDDQAYHFSIISKDGDTIASRIKCCRDVGVLVKRIKKFTKNHDFLVGYEATYVGYDLYRKLEKLSLTCKIIAPSSIPKAPQDRVKNDGIDSFRLAKGLYRDEFCYVAIPTAQQETDRMLLRSRAFLVETKSDIKRHILSQCRLLDLDYKKATDGKDYWTKIHRKWLDAQVKILNTSARMTLATLIQQLESLERNIATLEVEIDHLSNQDRYANTVKALTCFKGIETVNAMTIATEIFDINRFPHPDNLASYSGLDITEHSSGGKQNQFGITKMGNKRLRTVLVESCQMFGTSKTPSKRKQASRKGVEPTLIAIADKCQERIYKKGHRLLAREKQRNKVKVACAREMVGFIWEAMKKVS